MSTGLTPQQAWDQLAAGNARFVSGHAEHPRQDSARLAELVEGQSPSAAVFGCGDSRVAPELLFDQGLGDVFVVRNAAHVPGNEALGAVEFAVGLLSVPVLVVLGHRGCGAVAATIQAADSGELPDGFVRDLVTQVMPSVLGGREAGLSTAQELEAEHVVRSIGLILERSTIVRERVESGRCAIVGGVYQLDGGAVKVVHTHGPVTV